MKSIAFSNNEPCRRSATPDSAYSAFSREGGAKNAVLFEPKL
jgi:hypothetical protein